MGVPNDKRVYLRGWCYATDPVYVAEHPEPWRSPAMEAASSEALRCAGVGIDDVTHLDLYSCFASSVNLAVDALGVTARRGDELTVTGGLPFSGGAGSDYMMHSIATMTDVLRNDPGSTGMVSGVGMHLTKHVFGVYSTTPPADGRVRPPREMPKTVGDTKTITPTHAGRATVATYTVAHGRDGGAEWGVAVCDLPDGTRAYGRLEGAELLAHVEANEWVGATVDLVAGDNDVNLVKT